MVSKPLATLVADKRHGIGTVASWRDGWAGCFLFGSGGAGGSLELLERLVLVLLQPSQSTLHYVSC